MKTAKCAIVTYKDNTIHDYKIFTAQGDFIRMELGTRQFDNIKDMLNHIVSYARTNGFEISYTKMFNAKFYNIVLVDLDTGYINDTLAI